MAYVSGRTVKTSRKVAKTPVAAATAATRQAIKDVVGAQAGITIKTVHGYDATRLVDTLVTTVTYPAGTAYERLRSEIMVELGTMDVVAGEYAMTIIRRA
jgi:hypothetical protein